MDWPDAVRDCLPWRRWPWSHRDHTRNRRLVQDDHKAILESARLRVRPSLVDAVLHDGDCGLAGLGTSWISRRETPTWPVWRATCFKCRVVVDLLCVSSAGLGICRDRNTVAGNSCDDGGVLPPLRSCGKLDGAVPGVGELCEYVELRDLAVESMNAAVSHGSSESHNSLGVPWRHSTSGVATRYGQ